MKKFSAIVLRIICSMFKVEHVRFYLLQRQCFRIIFSKTLQFVSRFRDIFEDIVPFMLSKLLDV